MLWLLFLASFASRASRASLEQYLDEEIEAAMMEMGYWDEHFDMETAVGDMYDELGEYAVGDIEMTRERRNRHQRTGTPRRSRTHQIHDVDDPDFDLHPEEDESDQTQVGKKRQRQGHQRQRRAQRRSDFDMDSRTAARRQRRTPRHQAERKRHLMKQDEPRRRSARRSRARANAEEGGMDQEILHMEQKLSSEQNRLQNMMKKFQHQLDSYEHSKKLLEDQVADSDEYDHGDLYNEWDLSDLYDEEWPVGDVYDEWAIGDYDEWPVGEYVSPEVEDILAELEDLNSDDSEEEEEDYYDEDEVAVGDDSEELDELLAKLDRLESEELELDDDDEVAVGERARKQAEYDHLLDSIFDYEKWYKDQEQAIGELLTFDDEDFEDPVGEYEEMLVGDPFEDFHTDLNALYDEILFDKDYDAFEEALGEDFEDMGDDDFEDNADYEQVELADTQPNRNVGEGAAEYRETDEDTVGHGEKVACSKGKCKVGEPEEEQEEKEEEDKEEDDKKKSEGKDEETEDEADDEGVGGTLDDAPTAETSDKISDDDPEAQDTQPETTDDDDTELEDAANTQENDDDDTELGDEAPTESDSEDEDVDFDATFDDEEEQGVDSPDPDDFDVDMPEDDEEDETASKPQNKPKKQKSQTKHPSKDTKKKETGVSEDKVSQLSKKEKKRQRKKKAQKRAKKKQERLKAKYKRFEMKAMRRHMNLWRAYQTMDDGLPEGPGPFVEEEATRLDDDPNDVDFAKMAREEKERKKGDMEAIIFGRKDVSSPDESAIAGLDDETEDDYENELDGDYAWLRTQMNTPEEVQVGVFDDLDPYAMDQDYAYDDENDFFKKADGNAYDEYDFDEDQLGGYDANDDGDTYYELESDLARPKETEVGLYDYDYEEPVSRRRRHGYRRPRDHERPVSHRHKEEHNWDEFKQSHRHRSEDTQSLLAEYLNKYGPDPQDEVALGEEDPVGLHIYDFADYAPDTEEELDLTDPELDDFEETKQENVKKTDVDKLLESLGVRRKV